MKVFWAWQSDHPRKISRDVIRTALEEAIDQLKEERDVIEAPEESRGDLHLDHDTKGLTGSPDVARSILEKIQAATVFVGDVTPVGKTPDVLGNEGIKPGRPLINSNVAIEYGFALRMLTDSAVIGVLNEAFGDPKDLPFDIIHKRWPIRYRLVEQATKAEIDAERAKLRGQFVTALRGFLARDAVQEDTFEEIQPKVGKALYFTDQETLGFAQRTGGRAFFLGRDVIYMRIIPTKVLPRPVSEKVMIAASQRYGAMGGANELTFLNEYGSVSYSLLQPHTIGTLTQYFPNGEVWAVDTRLMKNGDREDEGWYTVVSAEDMFIATLENALKYFQQVGGEFPVKVSAGAVGLKGRRIVISGRGLHMHGRMMTDEVHYTRLLQNDSLETQDKYLLGLFEKIFDQSGAPRPKGLNGFPKQ